jgi:two-component system, LytTR family, response regulator
MTRFRALVVEDEPLARRMVAELLRRDPEIEHVSECASADEARTLLARDRLDMAFLDIEMPGSSGLELAQGLAAGGPVVVFVTAFGRYATEAFDVLAVDYVLKPFSDERFATAVGRAKTRVRERRLAALATQLATVSEELKPPARTDRPAYLSRLSFRQDDHSVIVSVADVIWIEAEDYYVLVHTRQGRHMVRASLASFEERLDPERFVRVHRAAIVSVHDVREVHDAGGLLLVLSDGSHVPVSRARRRQVEPLMLPRLGR